MSDSSSESDQALSPFEENDLLTQGLLSSLSESLNSLISLSSTSSSDFISLSPGTDDSDMAGHASQAENGVPRQDSHDHENVVFDRERVALYALLLEENDEGLLKTLRTIRAVFDDFADSNLAQLVANLKAATAY